MSPELSRRSVLAALAAAPFALKAANTKIPIGLELYSVRDELKKDEFGTLDRVAKMGYEVVEFYAPYYDWDVAHAKEIRKKLDDVGMRCYSTHNGRNSFSEAGMGKAIELNKILGTHYIVLAHPGNVTTIDGWKQVAEILANANEAFAKEGLHAGYHNHDLEWKAIDGQLPLGLIADSTDKSVMMQLDVGTCVEEGHDPVAWINKNPGRIKSMHLKDWSPDRKYRVLFGQGKAPWPKLFEAAESTGGVEYYLIEQEGSDYGEFETADRCLVAYKGIHG
jgi:sugar phosphate isomerase/epimerase